jgi:hypothetical protein
MERTVAETKRLPCLAIRERPGPAHSVTVLQRVQGYDQGCVTTAPARHWVSHSLTCIRNSLIHFFHAAAQHSGDLAAADAMASLRQV